MVFLRPVRSLGVFGVLKRLGFKFLRPGKILVENLFLGAFVCFGEGLIATWAANIYLLDQGQKVQSGFGLQCVSLLDVLLPGILLTAILLGLGMDEEP